MSRRKRRSVKETKKRGYSKDLLGLFFIIISIIGIGSFGIIGDFIKTISIFFSGSLYLITLLLFAALGIYLIADRKTSSLINSRLIGVYIIIVSLLVFSHVNYIENNDLSKKEIISSTYYCIASSYNNEANNFNEVDIRHSGGGMLGATLSFVFVSLFDIEGTEIVTLIFVVVGIILIFDITLSDIFKSIVNYLKKVFSKDPDLNKMTLEEMKKLSEETEENKKVVITSISDIQHKPETKEETVGTIEKVTLHDQTEYVKPPITLLNSIKNKTSLSNEHIAQNIEPLQRVFADFGIKAKVVEAHVGPAVTQFELEVERGTRVSKITSMSREIGLALAAKDVRIEAPIRGKGTIGIEIPNPEIATVSLREMMELIPKKYSDIKLLAPLGRDIMGTPRFFEIDKTPHMLVAGATGSGKSVCINNIIITLIMRTTPEEVKLVLIDPKKVEFNVYEGIPHLDTPVVTDPKQASKALQTIVNEMDKRYETFKNTNTKSIKTYNEYIEKKLKKNPDCGERKMPYIIVIIDELADLMVVAAKEVEESIMRITQLARAAGIHLIVATQRPSTDVITGIIKANIPSRISFAVSSSIDSRTILDMTGAEKLLGKGDMLYKPIDDNTPLRIQGSFVSDEEIKKISDFVKSKNDAPQFDESYNNLGKSAGKFGENDDSDVDVIYNDVLEYAIHKGQISASLIQRRYQVGYNRAARIIEAFEERGIVGPPKGSKPRDVLIKLEEKGD